ncbi:MAG: mercury resistance system periplasmic binding protein MerP [Ramlibacter sp.]
MKTLITVALLCVWTLPSVAAPATITLSVPSMDCPVCPITIKKALGDVPGVTKAQVSFEKRQATVTYDDTKTDVAALSRATKNAGYPSTLVKTTK